MVSVSDVVGIAALRLRIVVDAAQDARVLWVATSELADPTPFLEGGEIFLTTGLLHRDNAGWATLVRGLVDSGVVALGFGVGLSHPLVPTALRDAAERMSLNLFVVPRSIPFIAVTRGVADLLWAAERDADHQSLSHQRALTNAALHPQKTAEVLRTLANIVRGNVALVTWDGRILAHSGSVSSASTVVQNAQSLVERLHTAGPHAVATDILSDHRTIVYAVGSISPADSYLVVASGAAKSAAQRAAITMALALLALERARSVAERDARRRIQAGAMALILRSEVAAARELLADLTLYTVIPADRARIVRVRGGTNDVNRFLDSVERDASKLGHPLVATITVESGEAHLAAAVGAGEENLRQLIGITSQLLVGVGPLRAINALRQSNEGALQALASSTIARPIVLWSELVSQGFDALISDETAHVYATSLLDGVLAHSEASELLKSLHAFLAHNGKVGPAAFSCGVHRNTLRHRLKTAEDTLGRELNDPQLRADLWFALKHLMGDLEAHEIVRIGLDDLLTQGECKTCPNSLP